MFGNLNNTNSLTQHSQINLHTDYSTLCEIWAHQLPEIIKTHTQFPLEYIEAQQYPDLTYILDKNNILEENFLKFKTRLRPFEDNTITKKIKTPNILCISLNSTNERKQLSNKQTVVGCYIFKNTEQPNDLVDLLNNTYLNKSTVYILAKKKDYEIFDIISFKIGCPSNEDMVAIDGVFPKNTYKHI